MFEFNKIKYDFDFISEVVGNVRSDKAVWFVRALLKKIQRKLSEIVVSRSVFWIRNS